MVNRIAITQHLFIFMLPPSKVDNKTESINWELEETVE